jgi:hypothetical protein
MKINVTDAATATEKNDFAQTHIGLAERRASAAWQRRLDAVVGRCYS